MSRVQRRTPTAKATPLSPSKLQSHSSPRPRRRTLRRVIAGIALGALVLGTAATLAPTAAEAATGVSSIMSVTGTVGDNRVVNVAIRCTGTVTCSGTYRMASTPFSTSSKAYSVAKNTTKTFPITLTAAQYAKVTTKGIAVKAVLGQKKPTVKTITRALTLTKASPRVSLKTTSVIVDNAGKPTVSLACAAGAACRGTVSPTIGGVAGTKTAYSIAAGKTATVTLTVSAAQRAKLTTKASAQKLVIAETAPAQIGATRALSMTAASASIGQKTTTATLDDSRVVAVGLSCATGAACSGTLTPKVAGIAGSPVSYSVAAGKTGTARITLTTAQAAQVTANTALTVTVAEAKPRAVASTWTIRLTKAAAATTLSGVAANVSADGAAMVTLRCAAGAACAGTLTPTVAGVSGTATAFTMPAAGSAEIAVPLSAAARAALTTTPSALSVRIAETAPRAVTTSGSAMIAATAYSVAYRERNWTPTTYDTCPAALHASYTATGPDGKVYPTWHPAQVIDPATGVLCSFGHEHGDDPATSDIADWLYDYLAPTGDHSNEGLPFGYGSEELANYGAHHSDLAMRHEDNGGHKVFVANNVKLLDENRDWVMMTTASGAEEIVECDYLIKQHQGSWSPDATSNNAHELIYASKCTDGTEIITTMLSRFGNSNEFLANCNPARTITTVGSLLPLGDGGTREIPTSSCVAASAADGNMGTWDLYELWKGENALTTDTGTVLASFDPWFGVRNPSRYFDEASSTATTNAVKRPVDLAWGDNPVTGDLWSQVGSTERYDYRDPRSPFDGSVRDFYTNQNRVSAAVSAPTIFTDPYGGSAGTVAFPGALKQHLVSGSATTTATLATQRSAIVDHGAGVGVHAPN